MNFTREPIIETIITPKEGYKLVVRNSKGDGQEEHFVDAVEVVSFGHSFFFRSLERPKPFLVPVSDYEIVEVKETRVVLKNASIERAIKIGGGRDASVRHAKEAPAEKVSESEEVEVSEETSAEPAMEHRLDKRRDRRRHRRRRGGEERFEGKEWSDKNRLPEETQAKTEANLAEDADRGGGTNDEAQVSSSTFSTLFPPPSTLISETIGRYKDMAFSEGSVLPKEIEEETVEEKVQEQDKSEPEEENKDGEDENKKEKDDDDEEPPASDSSPLNRMTTSFEAADSFSSTSYHMSSPFSNGSFFLT